jgi:hypothetical protein
MAHTGDGAATLYAELENRYLARDQVGATRVFHELVRAGRPVTEIARETVRVHAPYTHVPYHQRIDRGFVRFVNNDHCLLSARASLFLPAFVSPELRYLPMAQTVWYVPTALDQWDQLLGKAPGHYGRRTWTGGSTPPFPRPTIHWADQEPLHLDAPYEEGLDHWLTLVQQGRVIEAYRVFLGLFEHRQRRRDLFAQLAFAGLIDVQDRMLYNRSYTTGHKAYRARATIDLGNAIGWDDAHAIVYAGALDMAVGPRWHSAYEMACQVSWLCLADEQHRNQSSLDPSPSVVCEERLLGNRAPLTPAEARELQEALTQAPEPAYIDALTALLLAGRDPLAILDTMQIAIADLLLETGDSRNFSMPQHCFQYSNTLRWFLGAFAHPHRLKLLYVAGSFVNQTAHWIRATPGNGAADTRPPQGAAALSADEILHRLDAAQVAMKPAESVAWTRAYLAGGHDRMRLVGMLALDALKHGNDTHNQEIALCLLDDYCRDPRGDRERLLLACAHHTAGHQKYGDTLEPYRRYLEAVGLSDT